jgi:glycolate oxidase FAD binding subunit
MMNPPSGEPALNWPDPSASAGPLGDGQLATAVDRPNSLEALQETVRRRVEDGLAIYPQGGRTALDYGGTPRRPGVAVDMTAMARVIDYPAADMTITVESGITLAALAKLLDAESQRLEIDAPEPERATIGGVYATNATGPRRYGSGRPRDQIIGVGFVTADGNLVKGGGRVVKNVAGYDFPKLITGSLGTLGVIAQLTLKVRPKPETAAIACVNYPGLEAVAHDLERLNTSTTRPVAIELLNVSAAGSLPGADGSPWTIVLAFEDNAASVAWQLDRIGAELSGKSVQLARGEDVEPIRTALRDSPALPGLVSLVANVRLSVVPQLASAVDPALWALQAHAGNGVVRLRAVGNDLAAIEADTHRLRAMVETTGGNLIVARCPAEHKPSFNVWGSPRPDWVWSERVKDALDPGGVMNPGRFVGKI